MKVMIAAVLKRHSSATNVWIAQKLNMGIPQAVSQNVGKLGVSGIANSKRYQQLRNAMLDGEP
jgi:ribosomal protein L31E